MKKVVVVGGSGFIGSHVADHLSEAGYQVTIYDKTESQWLRDDQKFVVGDVQDDKKILATKDGFNKSAQDFVAEGGKGFNITLPFKIDAFKLANHLTPNAKTAGAVNTIKIENNELYGENTDGKGLEQITEKGIMFEGKEWIEV